MAHQREARVRTATDDEFRRTSWHMEFIYQLEGVDRMVHELDRHGVHFLTAYVMRLEGVDKQGMVDLVPSCV